MIRGTHQALATKPGVRSGRLDLGKQRHMTEPEVEWRRRAAGALCIVVAAGLVVGGVLGAVAYGAARITGLAHGGTQAAASIGAAHEGGGVERVAAKVSPSTPATSEPTPVARKPAGPDHAKAQTTRKPVKHDRAHSRHGAARHHAGHHARHHSGRSHIRTLRHEPLTLAAWPHRVRPMGRIHLGGRYSGHGGERLVVQRLQGGHWARFPVSVTVHRGRFTTWVASGHRGLNRFRVVDVRTHRASAPVTVRVG